MGAFIRRLLALVRRTRLERDLDDELSFHLAMRESESARPGIDPTAAAIARRQFGNVRRVKEQSRDAWLFALVESLLHDIRLALRALRRNFGFTMVAVLTLALGIGANTAIFSVVHAVLLRPLPYPESDRLVRFIEHPPPDAESVGYPQRLATVRLSDVPTLRSQATTLSHIGLYATGSMILAGRGNPVRLEITRLSPVVFSMLGVRPRLGRTFEAGEETPAADHVIVLAHTAWQRYFGGSLEIIGESLALDGREYSVIGVMPESFRFPDPETQLWTPYVLSATSARVAPIGRLAEGVSLSSASAQVGTLLHQLQPAAASPPAKPSTFELVPVQEELVGPVRPALVVLALAAGVVLLIACTNVANLLLARMAARGREMAVRVALGAGRARLARQLLTESVMLAICGGSAGILFAFGGVEMLRALGTSLSRRDLTPGVSIPRLAEIAVDLSALGFTLAVAIVAGVLFGLAPAFRQFRSQHTHVLREGAASTGSGFNLLRRHRMQGVLVVAEISMAMLLLVAGGLLMRSFIKLTNVDPGYDAVDVLTFNVASVATSTPPTFNDDFVAQLRMLPAVRAAGYAEIMPMVRFRSGGPLKPAQPFPGSTRPPRIDFRIVSRDFLNVMGMRIIEGRGFTEADGPDAPRVLLINRTLARSGYLGPTPLGARVYPTASNATWEVIGIVDDVRQYGLDQQPDAQVFIDTRQLPMGNPNPYFAVRSDRAPIALLSDLRAIAKQLNPAAMLDNIATMEQVVSSSASRPRLYAALMAGFAAVAALLAAIGIYGVMAYSVSQRTREIGIRMALGAQRVQVMKLVINQSLIVTVAGVGLGLVGAAAVTRYLEEFLFGLAPLDALTFIGVSLTFVLLAAIASYVPARRATKVDPLVALRCE